MTDERKKEFSGRAILRWALAGIALYIGAGWLGHKFFGQSIEEHLRNIILFVGGGIGLAIAARRAQAADEQAGAAQKQAEQQSRQVENVSRQIEISEQGQITERFTRAIEQLGSDKLFLRVGAIAALERIGRDSKDDVLTVLNLLSGFVRENSPVKAPSNEQPNPPPLDILECVYALSRLARQYDSFLKNKDFRVDLSKTELPYMESPEGACFAHFDFSNSNLPHGRFFNIKCNGVWFEKTNLANANFKMGTLSRANFSFANLAGTTFASVDLSCARFREANLTKVRFSDSTLDFASFREADMTGVNLLSSWCNKTWFTQAKNITTKMLSDIRFHERTPPENIPEGIELPNPIDA